MQGSVEGSLDSLSVTVLLRHPPLRATRRSAGANKPFRERIFLSREEFAARRSADPMDVELVRKFAERGGLRIESIEGARRAIRLVGTRAALGSAFGVRVRTPERGNVESTETDRLPRVPQELEGVVRGVFGLDNRLRLRPHFRINKAPGSTGYPIPVVGAAYEFPSTLTGIGTTIGLLEFGGGYSTADLSQYFSSIGTSMPEVVAVSVDGASNAPTGDPSGPDAEVELDIEMAGALAPGARIVVYFAPNTEQGFVDALTTAIHDASNHPSVISISWGGPEPSWSDHARTALEDAAQDGDEMGVTILAASGDQGATDGETGGKLAVDFPASSPYVLGCGGTRLKLTGHAIASEVVWNDLAEGEGATGGGVSVDFPIPSYQAGSRVPLAPNGFAGRGVPDVAADADPETGYSVYVDGAPAVIGGTSASAPLWAALLARLTQGLGKPLGYVNPQLYTPTLATGFRGITSGNNAGYAAAPGWNACTGLGSPRGAALLAGLQA
jgi:kumamolisin